MEPRPDGRSYSRITRRSVAVIRYLHTGRVFKVSEIASEIHESKLPEFYLERFKKQMSIARTRDYVRYLRDLEAIAEREDGYTLVFRHRSADGEWAQALSDLALPHLARVLSKAPDEIPDLLESSLKVFYQKEQLPTLHDLASSFGIESGRAEEVFRWSIYIYTDGETCPFDIRHYPVLVRRSG